MDHFMDEHPVVFGRGDICLSAHADKYQPAIFGISNTMAYAGAGRFAHAHHEVRDREVAVIISDGSAEAFTQFSRSSRDNFIGPSGKVTSMVAPATLSIAFFALAFCA